jgi:hypothetical protein
MLSASFFGSSFTSSLDLQQQTPVKPKMTNTFPPSFYSCISKKQKFTACFIFICGKGKNLYSEIDFIPHG